MGLQVGSKVNPGEVFTFPGEGEDSTSSAWKKWVKWSSSVYIYPDFSAGLIEKRCLFDSIKKRLMIWIWNMHCSIQPCFKFKLTAKFCYFGPRMRLMHLSTMSIWSRLESGLYLSISLLFESFCFTYSLHVITVLPYSWCYDTVSWSWCVPFLVFVTGDIGSYIIKTFD